jgi:NADPH2:quinone reductase
VKRITQGEGVDIIIDSIGGVYIKKDINILRPNGRVIAMGGASFSDRSLSNIFSVARGAFSMSTLNSIDLLLHSKGFYAVNMKAIANKRMSIAQRAAQQVMKLFEQKAIELDTITEMPWEKISEAHVLIESRKSIGKIVLIVP